VSGCYENDNELRFPWKANDRPSPSEGLCPMEIKIIITYHYHHIITSSEEEEEEEVAHRSHPRFKE
jgi:hypothetical protein